MSRNPLPFGLVAAGLLLGAAACGAADSGAISSRHGAPAAAPASPGARTIPAASTGAGDAARASAAAPVPTPSGCPTPPPRRAFAEQISAAGKVTWQVRLPTDPVTAGISLRPLAIGAAAVFAEENAVYALARGDGHQLWKRVFAQVGGDQFAGMVYGLWRWRGEVIVLVGQVSSHSRLYSLNGATGAVNWTLSLGGQGEIGTLTLTGDGGLAMIHGHATLTVVDLATGRIRWARAAGPSIGPVATGGVVIAAAAGKVRGFSSKTGAPLWTRTGMPGQASLLVSAGRVIVSDDTQNVFPPVPLWPVTALSPATGRTLWRAGTGTALYSQSAGPSGVAVVTAGRQLILINAATGHVRWRVHDADSALPVDTGTDLFYLNGPPSGSRPTLVDVRAATGSVRWSVPAPATLNGQVFRFGPYAMAFEYPGDGVNGPGTLVTFRLSTGGHAWRVTVPAFIAVPPLAAGTDLLVQLTDLSVGCAFDGTAIGVGTVVASSGAGSSR